TMAELYLRQGFRDRALEIYRQLQAQNPGSAALRERVRQLESGERGRSNGKESIRDFFAGLTTRRPAHPPAAREGGGEGETPHEWALPQERADGSTGASAQDEAAASALASAFVDRPDHPPTSETRPGASGGGDTVSFDDFFAPPHPPSADAPGADRDSGERADEASESDLASFHAWLAGLKK
ncbi:MAG: hypothetical protein M3068_13310, partial [Gemmatimonadota bacterium]|nr:hypothetical protein [Gemmatimonadota bacterium]